MPTGPGRNLVGWRIWTDDGEVFSSENVSPEDIPSDGILIILHLYDNRTHEFVAGSDYYLWNGDEWQGGGLPALERWLRLLVPQLKYGRLTRNRSWNIAVATAGAWLKGADLESSEMTGTDLEII